MTRSFSLRLCIPLATFLAALILCISLGAGLLPATMQSAPLRAFLEDPTASSEPLFWWLSDDPVFGLSSGAVPLPQAKLGLEVAVLSCSRWLLSQELWGLAGGLSPRFPLSGVAWSGRQANESLSSLQLSPLCHAVLQSPETAVFIITSPTATEMLALAEDSTSTPPTYTTSCPAGRHASNKRSALDARISWNMPLPPQYVADAIDRSLPSGCTSTGTEYDSFVFTTEAKNSSAALSHVPKAVGVAVFIRSLDDLFERPVAGSNGQSVPIAEWLFASSEQTATHQLLRSLEATLLDAPVTVSSSVYNPAGLLFFILLSVLIGGGASVVIHFNLLHTLNAGSVEPFLMFLSDLRGPRGASGGTRRGTVHSERYRASRDGATLAGEDIHDTKRGDADSYTSEGHPADDDAVAARAVVDGGSMSGSADAPDGFESSDEDAGFDAPERSTIADADDIRLTTGIQSVQDGCLVMVRYQPGNPSKQLDSAGEAAQRFVATDLAQHLAASAAFHFMTADAALVVVDEQGAPDDRAIKLATRAYRYIAARSPKAVRPADFTISVYCTAEVGVITGASGSDEQSSSACGRHVGVALAMSELPARLSCERSSCGVYLCGHKRLFDAAAAMGAYTVPIAVASVASHDRGGPAAVLELHQLLLLASAGSSVIPTQANELIAAVTKDLHDALTTGADTSDSEAGAKSAAVLQGALLKCSRATAADEDLVVEEAANFLQERVGEVLAALGATATLRGAHAAPGAGGAPPSLPPEAAGKAPLVVARAVWERFADKDLTPGESLGTSMAGNEGDAPAPGMVPNDAMEVSRGGAFRDADDVAALEALLDELLADKAKREAEKEARRAEKQAKREAELAATPPDEQPMNLFAMLGPEDDGDGGANGDDPADDGGFGLFNFMAPVDDSDDELEEELVEPQMFTDTRGTTWQRSDRALGKGAFGKVYVGMGEDGALVAIKGIPVLKVDAAECKLAVREVALLTRLKHENIVEYVGGAVDKSFLLVIMEAMGGGSLHGLMCEHHQLSEKWIKRYLRDVLAGLRYLHSNGILHRDIKPHNVLLTNDGRCKLADFGTAAFLGSQTMKRGDVGGTPIYMAPESCLGNANTHSDVWSVGVMAYQLATGELPWHPSDAGNPLSILHKLGRDPEFRPTLEGLPAGALKDFVALCLTYDADERPSADALLKHPYLAGDSSKKDK